MVLLIKKGGLRERANRSRRYHGSENTETTLKPNQYRQSSNQQSEPTGNINSDASVLKPLNESTSDQ
ncbi:hypothetical protein A3K93_07270 [Acinetobacter sp. NCu2D-2]|uniref:hypothetical protein n=1 Tax=Acinetobacter sp. NCu2D-2 TaxID=1608473 RepID=UPI0007CDFC9D|nr:hypothetical protein [Acinetobacter sp. NCu2D-2]ANF82017.1 hypothetical protein A3K93_07270 [Acinetobacter sp. NCu2D-2]